MRKKCLQHLLHKGSPGVQLIIAIRAKKIAAKYTAIFRDVWETENKKSHPPLGGDARRAEGVHVAYQYVGRDLRIYIH